METRCKLLAHEKHYTAYGNLVQHKIKDGTNFSQDMLPIKTFGTKNRAFCNRAAAHYVHNLMQRRQGTNSTVACT